MTSNPPVKEKADFKVLIVYPNLPLMLIPSIAIGLFTRILRDAGYQVDLFETTLYPSDEPSSTENRVKLLNAREFSITKDLGIAIKSDLYGDFRKKVESFKPDLMIYSVVEDSFRQTLSLLREIEDLKVPHLIGGVFPTNAPERCLEFPEINLVGLGEGEHTVVETAETIRLGRPLDTIRGTMYRDLTGTIHRNPAFALASLDDCRPDFSLIEEVRFYRPMGGRVFKMVPVETYRGCPYSCTYCNSPGQRVFAQENAQGHFLRRKSMSVLRDELREYVDTLKPTFFYFVDDSFLARPRGEILEFCDMYEEFRLPFWFNTRTESCEPDILARLKEVGCYRISFGIECGNEDYRRRVLRRQISNAELVRRFGFIAESGIAFSLNVIIGMPGETRDLVMDTIELIRAVPGYDALTVNTFTPYHGTVLRQVAVNNGWLAADTITRHTTSSSLLEMPPPYLNPEEIDGLVATFPLYTYFPKSEWENIRRAETPDEVGLEIREGYAKRYREEFLGQTQDDRTVLRVEGGTGCRTNPKDAFLMTPQRLSDDEIQALMVPRA